MEKGKGIPEFKKTILVGLGGAGKLICTHLKRLFIDEYGIVPPSIKFLSLDTDLAPISIRSALSQREYSLDDKEFLHMKVDQPVEFIKNSSVNNWFIKPLPAGSISKGAGAIRQVGRLAFFYHINEFKRRFDNLHTQLNAQDLNIKMAYARDELGANTNFILSESDPEVYICGSLAGGTGSGTFLDVGIFLRDQVPNALIHGFFLLNWVYRNKAFANRVPCNVYAALSELDNMQSIMFGDKEFAPYKISYADKEVIVDKPPFSLVHLVDGRNEYGQNINEVGNLCETTANAIFLSVGSMGDAVASVVDNLLAHIHVSPPGIWNGKYARYSSFGVSSIYYPAVELHKLISVDNANKLCSMALSEVEGAARNPNAASQRNESIQLDVNNSLGQNALNLLNRVFVSDKVCPFQAPIAFPIQPFFVSDKGFPAMIDHQFAQEKKNLTNKLNLAWEENSKQFIQDTIMALDLKINDIIGSPKFDQAYLKGWIDESIDLLTTQLSEITKAINTETETVNNHLENSTQLKDISVQSRYIPFVGGARKKAVENWAVAITSYFASFKKLCRFEFENKFYSQILEFLRSKKPSSVDSPSEVLNALNNTQNILRNLNREEQANLKILKSKSNQILIGNGNSVIIPGEKDNVSFLNTIDCDYEEFKTENNINNPEDYLSLNKEDPNKLVNLFIDHCRNKLHYIKEFSLQEAMDTIGKKMGNKDGYVKEQINHLFRLSSALWSFNRGKLSEIQGLQYDKIVNLGVYDKDEGSQDYNQAVMDVKGKYNIRADHSFSTTGDKYRIWIVNFAAALPVCYLSDLEQSRKKYENEISPTYHIDKYFEMNVPDLFPMNNVANRALRILGMAIVPGIDVVQDEKLSKGHKFIFNDPEFVKINFGEATWYLFKDMYDDVIDSFDPKDLNNLLDILSKRLKEKVESMSQEDLQAAIVGYLDKVKAKMNDRDFSKLASARLMYREIKGLQGFLDPKQYAMDIDRYINGKS
ncbi:MAG: tubulin-like doman-containing protein [Pseudomonadota bacterium]